MSLTRRAIALYLGAPLLLALTSFWSPARSLALVWLGVATALVVVDGWRAGVNGRFRLRRDHDSRLSIGADNAIQLTLENRSPQPLTFTVRDEPPDDFVVQEQLFAGQVAGRGSWTTIYTVHPVRRGDYAFGDLWLRWLGPLGLVARQTRIDAAGPVQVYPNLLNIRRFDLLLRQNRLANVGLRHARLFGEGTEFERLRDYLPDDEYRRINWKATARRRRPITVEYQTERSQTILVAIDIGRMMQSPVANMAKLDYALNAVLLLGYVAAGMGDRVGLLTFADSVVQYLPPRSGRGQFQKMLALLYGVEAQPVEPDYRQAITYLARKQRRRALIVFFTDLTGGASMEALSRHIQLLAPVRLPLVVTINDPGIVAAAEERPSTPRTVYTRAAARQQLAGRRLALDRMARRGVLTLDVAADQLAWSVIGRYLELKGRGRI